MARFNSNQSVEDYLEAILVVQQHKGCCRSVDVANHLGFSKASVSVAVSNMSQRGYVRKLASGELMLTPKGREYAASVLKRHLLIARALAWLGVPQDVAEADACRIEHDISDETYARLSEWYRRTFEAT